MYAVCKNGRCAQTYPVKSIMNGRTESEFMCDIQPTNGYRCEKCGNVVVDKEGRALLSNNPTVIPYITVEELQAQEQRELKDAKRTYKQAKKELKRLTRMKQQS